MTLTFKRDGIITAVSTPVAEIRDGKDSSGALLLRLDAASTYLTQGTPGVIVIAIPEAVTETLAAGRYYWDMFGTVAGSRIKLVDVSTWTIIAHVTLDTDP